MEKRDAYTALREKVLNKIIEGRKQLLVWGYTPACVQLLTELNTMGVLDWVSGIIDSDACKQGQMIFHLAVFPPQEISKLPLDVLVIASDDEKEGILRKFAELDNRLPDVVLSGSRHYAFKSDLFDQIVASSSVRSIAGGYSHMLVHIFQSLEYLVKSKIEGAVAEFGIFQGGTLAIISKTLKRSKSSLKHLHNYPLGILGVFILISSSSQEKPSLFASGAFSYVFLTLKLKGVNQ